MRYLNFKPVLALLIPFALSACTPAVNAPLVTVVDGFTFAPGQRWEVTAQGGGGYADSTTFELDTGMRNTDGSGFLFKTPRYGANIDYSDLQAGGYPVYIRAGWFSTGEKTSQTKGLYSSCNVRSPRWSSLNPPTLEGRWTIDISTSGIYLRTGETKNTGTCTIRLLQN